MNALNFLMNKKKKVFTGNIIKLDNIIDTEHDSTTGLFRKTYDILRIDAIFLGGLASMIFILVPLQMF